MIFRGNLVAEKLTIVNSVEKGAIVNTKTVKQSAM
jgi:hypothetical protein